jgi:hypothetical protein
MSANRTGWVVLCLAVVVGRATAQPTAAPVPPASVAQPGSVMMPPGGAIPSADLTGVPALDTLTTPPMVPAVPGAVYSPWAGGGGGSGPVSYEGYLRTGPTLLTGGGELTAVLKTFGWNVQGGARTLFFNEPGDAAWVLDLGIGFTFNDGRRDTRRAEAFTEGDFPAAANNNPDTTQPRLPDVLTTVSVLGLRRTSLNFAIGRDYFLNGPGAVGQGTFGNLRFGWDVGGRWGTASLGYRPDGDPGGFRRRQDVYHGLFLGTQYTWEKPMGAWTWFCGGRLEWSYYWTNMLPPRDGDFRDANFLMMFGVRF